MLFVQLYLLLIMVELYPALHWIKLHEDVLVLGWHGMLRLKDVRLVHSLTGVLSLINTAGQRPLRS